MSEQEKTRTCPTCRCEISVLATRCRFCGASIGRPKEAVRNLTISDLGGETIYHRAPSGSVLDAMESFRAEEEAGIAEKQDEPEFVQPNAPVAEMPDLDADPSDLLGLSDGPTMSSVRAQHQPSGSDRLMTIAITVGVLIAVIFGGIKGVEFIQNRQAAEEVVEEPTYHNRAPDILRAGGPSIDALEAAVEADEIDPNPMNSRILEDAFLNVKEEVEGVLNAKMIDLDALRSASKLAASAVELYPNQSSIALKEEVDRDNSDYKLVLMSTGAGTATFKLSNPNRTVDVKRGDVILDRFQVQSVVGQKVKLEDTRRGNRVVIFDSPGALPR